MYPKQATHLQHYFGPEICALVTMQLSESSVPHHNLKYQLPSDRRSLLIRDGEALEPFRKVASHHEAVLVPCRGDGVGSGDIHRQAFHQNPDDVLVQRIPSSPSFLRCAVAFVADPAPYPRPFQHLSLLPWWPCHCSSWDPVDSPLVRNLTSLVPSSLSFLWEQLSARPSPIVYLRCPIICL